MSTELNSPVPRLSPTTLSTEQKRQLRRAAEKAEAARAERDRLIREHRAAGVSLAAIAEQVGLTAMGVSKIASRPPKTARERDLTPYQATVLASIRETGETTLDGSSPARLTAINDLVDWGFVTVADGVARPNR
jgi:hypothetical protein